MRPPRKRRKLWRWAAVLAVLALLVVGVSYVWNKTSKIFTNDTNIFARVGNLIVSSDKPLKGEDEGLVNVLLLGIGGSGHDGAYLTDTMIVAQLNTETHEVTLISIPRDFGLTLPNVGFTKINAAYAYAISKGEQAAAQAAMAAAQQVTGFEMHYYALVDFKGFVEAVDTVGGLDIVIDNTFTDSTFPNDYPYDTRGYLAPVKFTKGPEHMDGRRALIFARSRHSDNPQEGSDFARSERQKKILVAFKERLLHLGITDLRTINNLLSNFTDNFRTNLEPHEMKRFMTLAKEIDGENVYSFSLEPDGILICSALVDPATGRPVPAATQTAEPDQDENTDTDSDTETPDGEAGEETQESPAAPQIVRMYVVLPCGGHTVEDIREYVINAPILAKLKSENAQIEIQNSVGVTGLAARTFGHLADFGITINYTTFTGDAPYEQTVLYDNSRGGKPKTRDHLNQNFTLVTSDINYPNSPADFVIIVGRDLVK